MLDSPVKCLGQGDRRSDHNSIDKRDFDYSESFFSGSNDYNDYDDGDYEGCSGSLRGCLRKVIVIAIINFRAYSFLVSIAA